MSPTMHDSMTQTRGRSCGWGKSPDNEERHPLCLAAMWGGVSDYERLLWPRPIREYLILSQGSLDARFGVSLPGDGR